MKHFRAVYERNREQLVADSVHKLRYALCV